MAKIENLWDSAIWELNETLDKATVPRNEFTAYSTLDGLRSEGEPDNNQAMQRLHISELLRITAYQNKLLEGIYKERTHLPALKFYVGLLVLIEGARFFL